MKSFEIVYKNFIIKFGFWPFIITISVVLLIIVITIILVVKELKGSR